jgi:glycosyltransferase involved in cell wall biosynthesis
VRVLIFGHHSHTGFGIVTENLGTRLVEAGVDVRIIAVNHRGGPVKGPLGERIWPAALYGDSHGANWSSAAITGQAWHKLDRSDDWKPDVVLVIADVSGLLAHMGGPIDKLPAWRSVPVFHYCPIEGDNLSIGWRTLWSTIRPVAMSTYGQRVIGEHIDRPVPMIYHGVDAETFRPVTFDDPIRIDGKVLRTKDDCKRQFGIEAGRKVILRTDRNALRKFYYRMFEALPAIFDGDPDVDVVLHCAVIDNDGMNLIEEVARLPARFHPRIRFTNQHDTYTGLSTTGLVALMNAADIYMSTTGGEGFGLTLAESLACEVPVVVTDWAADAEVVGPGGILVPPTIDTRGQPVRYHSLYGMDWALPDAQGFVAPVLDLLGHPAKRRGLGRLGRMHVRSSFSWDAATLQFIDLFAEAATESAAA